MSSFAPAGDAQPTGHWYDAADGAGDAARAADEAAAHDDGAARDDAAPISPRLVAFFALLPLSVEFIRRFVYYSDLLFVASEFAAVGLATVILLRTGSAVVQDTRVLAFLALIMVLGLLSMVFGHRSIMLMLIGARALLIPLAFAIIGEYIFRHFRDPLGFFFRYATIAVIVVTAIAILQVVLGSAHWLNRLPVAETGQGIGDYTAANGVVIAALFRPTSMFLHTGKFGQALFTLVLFQVAIMLTMRDKSPVVIGALLVVDLVGIAVSGQRAALVFLLIAFAFWASFARVRPYLGVFGTAMVSAALLAVLAAPLVDWQILMQVTERFLTSFDSVGGRLDVNFFWPLWKIVDFAGFTGDGWGMYSLGSGRFGGMSFVLSRYPVPAENSWLRLIAEMGPAGSLMHLAFFASLIVSLLRLSLRDGIGSAALYYVAAASWIGAVIGWSNTHDVIGNTTTTALGCLYLGALWSSRPTGSQ